MALPVSSICKHLLSSPTFTRCTRWQKVKQRVQGTGFSLRKADDHPCPRASDTSWSVVQMHRAPLSTPTLQSPSQWNGHVLTVHTSFPTPHTMRNRCMARVHITHTLSAVTCAHLQRMILLMCGHVWPSPSMRSMTLAHGSERGPVEVEGVADNWSPPLVSMRTVTRNFSVTKSVVFVKSEGEKAPPASALRKVFRG